MSIKNKIELRNASKALKKKQNHNLEQQRIMKRKPKSISTIILNFLGLLFIVLVIIALSGAF